jgi:hypothetical protein
MPGLLGALLLVAALVAAEEPSARVAGESAPSPWSVDPFLRPVLGLSRYSGDDGAHLGLQLGASAGLAIWRAPFLDRTRILAAWTTGGLDGLDLRLGSFVGMEKEHWGFSVGPDLFWNRYAAGGDDLLPLSGGVDLPLDVHFGPERLFVLAGLTPALLFEPDRRVDWADAAEEGAFGFGHELAWRLGVGARVGRAGFNLQYSRRRVVGGVLSGWGLSLSF